MTKIKKTGGAFSVSDSFALKGIAVLMLLFHHLYLSIFRVEKFNIDYTPFTQTTVLNVATALKICVSIFAFITGYGLLKSIKKTPLERSSVARWSIARIIKTMSGFWFIYVISFIVTYITPQTDKLAFRTYFEEEGLNGIAYMLIDFFGLANLLKTPTLNSTWWYMSAAIMFILIVPVAYAISKKVGYLPILLIVCALPRVMNLGYLGSTNLYTFIFPVLLGMIFADYELFEKIIDKSPKNKVLAYIIHFIVFSGIIFSGYFVRFLYDRKGVWEIVYGIMPVFFICFFRFCVLRLPVIKEILTFFGKHSMTIFLSHTFLRQYYLNNFIYTKGHFLVVYAVFVAVSLALALVLDVFKDIIKYDKLVSKATSKILKKHG